MPTPEIRGSATRRRLRSPGRLLVALATIVALAAVAPSALAGGAKPVHIEKVCVADGSSCTVTESNYGPIRKGTSITYVGGSFDSLEATVHVPGGVATGDCDIASVFGDGSPGSCVFTGGTGPLTHFTVTVSVSLVDIFGDGTSLWSWDWTRTSGNDD